MSLPLRELDSIEIVVLVNNDVDYISPGNNKVQFASGFRGVPLKTLESDDARGDAKHEFRMDSICCGAHGVSFLITATVGSKKHSIIFDAGPEGSVFEKNVFRMGLDLHEVQHVHLSHWHRDHSGGMIRAIEMIQEQKRQHQNDSNSPKVTVGVHPARPDFRGVQANGMTLSLEEDPSFEEIAAAGGNVDKSDASHTILDDTFGISGEVPRTTEYERGLKGGVRFSQATGAWDTDELIMDERYVMCNLKGKGLVVFSGCSHPGIVNICRDAVRLASDTPLHAIVGGFHLADGDATKVQNTVKDLKKLKPEILMSGHCTGWRFNFLAEQEMPDVLVPLSAGLTYTLTSDTPAQA